VFLGRALKAPQIRRVDRSSKTKLVHVVRVAHRDEVEAPMTDWLREAYDFSGAVTPRSTSQPAASAAKPRRKRAPAPKRKAASN
jgi:hypothetical protein